MNESQLTLPGLEDEVLKREELIELLNELTPSEALEKIRDLRIVPLLEELKALGFVVVIGLHSYDPISDRESFMWDACGSFIERRGLVGLMNARIQGFVDGYLLGGSESSGGTESSGGEEESSA